MPSAFPLQKALPGSPFTLKALPAPPHAASYKLTSKPKGWPTISAGVRFKVRIQAHDCFGNVVASAGCRPETVTPVVDEQEQDVRPGGELPEVRHLGRGVYPAVCGSH